jgi:hypothetical protein
MAPHTYLNKISGLKTFSTYNFEAGKKIHRIIQDHCSGVSTHDLLVNLPRFAVVETKDFDENLKISFSINDKFDMIGYVDMKDPDTFTMGEIKSGRVWSAGDFARLAQWKIYALGLPEYKKIYLINTPKELAFWTPRTIRVFSKEITDGDKEDARLFIKKGLNIIENLKEAVDEEMKLKAEKGYTGRDRNCFYQGCTYCQNDE